MSYSIFTLFESENAQEQMREFLMNNFRPLNAILPDTITSELSEGTPIPDNDLAYTGDFRDPLLGFDYGSGDCDIERGYRFAVCYWMAAIAGKRQNGHGLMVYDGSEVWTVCTMGDTCLCPATIHTDADGARKIAPLRLAETMLENGADLTDFIGELKQVDPALEQRTNPSNTRSEENHAVNPLIQKLRP